MKLPLVLSIPSYVHRFSTLLWSYRKIFKLMDKVQPWQQHTSEEKQFNCILLL